MADQSPHAFASTRPLAPHQQRVVEEMDELDGKIRRLRGFIETSSTFRDLPAVDQSLLRVQLHAMTAYSEVLDLRVSRFHRDPGVEG